MKTKVLLLSLALFIGGSAVAQEAVPREEALKVAFLLSLDLKELLNTPIPTDPDVKRPTAIKEGGYGAMILPESKLRLQDVEMADKTPAPVAQLWLRKLVPTVDNRPVASDKVRMVPVRAAGTEEQAGCVVLAVRKTNTGKELVMLGNSTEPVLTIPLTSLEGSSKEPVVLTAEKKEDGGLITLKLFGRYEASFMVTDPSKF